MRARVLLVVTLMAGLAAMASAQTKPAPKPAPKPAAPAAPAGRTPGAGPVIVVETVKGTFEFETYPNEAPRTVEHIVNLVKKNFYNGLRFHRVEPGFVIQAGDPNTRDYTKKDLWGTGGSGTPVGVSELSRKHKHVKGAVAMEHPGNTTKAYAPYYVMLGDRPSLDGKYVVFGQVISGFDVPAKIRVGDVIKRMYVKP